jgi:hypothetical protein
MKAAKSDSTNELCLELKYCERCGGLWLRPAGGSQVYCVACGRSMAELPPASSEPERARMLRGRRWGVPDGNIENNQEDEGVDLETSGGVA